MHGSSLDWHLGSLLACRLTFQYHFSMNSIHQIRRAAFLKQLGPNRAAVVFGSTTSLRNGSVSYPFRQNSDFLYLTAFPEPNAIAVFTPGQEKPFTLFVEPRDSRNELYTGPKPGLSEATSLYEANQVFPRETFEQTLPDLLQGYSEVVTSIGSYPSLERIVLDSISKLKNVERRGVKAPYRLADLRSFLHEQRLRKDEDALACLKKAASITKDAFVMAMKAAHGSGPTEHHVATMIDMTFRLHGGTPGYESIVACGDNALILHYMNGQTSLQHGQLLLIDAGCEWQGFTADVTRTFPIRKALGEPISFSPAQRKVYDWVLHAQIEGIRQARAGSTLDRIYETCRRVLTEGMVDLGLLKGDPEALIEQGAYKKFLPHLTNHWLGLDVHDVGEYYPNGKPRFLEDGMVFTIEPGLYIPIEDTIPKEYQGIGIRIEDDIVIDSTQAEGHIILTKEIPKAPEEVEYFLNEGVHLR